MDKRNAQGVFEDDNRDQQDQSGSTSTRGKSLIPAVDAGSQASTSKEKIKRGRPTKAESKKRQQERARKAEIEAVKLKGQVKKTFITEGGINPLASIRTRLRDLLEPAIDVIENVMLGKDTLPKDRLMASKYIVDTNLFIDKVEMEADRLKGQDDKQSRLIRVLAELSLAPPPKSIVDKFGSKPTEPEILDPEIDQQSSDSEDKDPLDLKRDHPRYMENRINEDDNDD